MSDFYLIAYITISTIFVPLGLAIIQWKKISPDIAALRWLLIASLVFDLVMVIMALQGINNLGVGDVFMFIHFITLLYIFSRQFTGKIFFVTAGLMVALFYTAGFFAGTSFAIPIIALSRSSAIDGLVLITVCIAFFYKLLNELKIVNIHRLPILWIAFATLFYYSGNLFVFLASNYLETDVDSALLIWNLHNILSVIKNLLFAVALWQSYRTVRITHG